MKKIIILIFAILITYTAKSQTLSANLQEKVDKYNSLISEYKSQGNSSGVINYLSKIGNIYWQADMPDNAISAYSEALNLLQSSANTTAKAQINNQLAYLYSSKGDYANAEKYFTDAYNIIKDFADRPQLASGLTNIAQAQQKQGKYQEAINHFDEALSIALELDDLEMVKNISLKLALSYQAIGDNQNYIKYYNLSANFNNKIKDREIQQKQQQIIAQQQRQRELDLQMELQQQTNKQIQDSLLLQQQINEKNSLNMQVLKQKQQIQEQELSQQEKEIEQQKKLANARRLVIIVLTLGFVILLIALIFIFRLFIQNKKQKQNLETLNSELTQKNTEIEKQKQNLETLNSELTQKNTEIEKQKQNLEVLNSELTQKNTEIEKQKQNLEILNSELTQKNTEIEKQKQNLEVLNSELTQKNTEIEKQKQNLEILNSELTQKNTEIEKHRKELEYKNQQIGASIKYASRIQRAILPVRAAIENAFKNVFFFYRPRDVVSGDFYWFTETKNSKIIAAIDCTGHSVPGAFVSMIANTLLNEIIKTNRITDLSEILNQLNKGVVKTLSNTNDEDDVNDGMDISIFKFNNDRTAQFASANHVSVIFVDGKKQILEADYYSIGGFSEAKNIKFQQINIDLGKKAKIYMFSDGFADQFNEKRKRYMSQNLFKFFTKIQNEPFKEQGQLLTDEFDQWRGSHRQIDDVLVIGIEI